MSRIAIDDVRRAFEAMKRSNDERDWLVVPASNTLEFWQSLYPGYRVIQQSRFIDFGEDLTEKPAAECPARFRANAVERQKRWREKNRKSYNAYMREYRKRKKPI